MESPIAGFSGPTYFSDAHLPNLAVRPPKTSASTAPTSPIETAWATAPNSPVLRSQSAHSIPLPPLPPRLVIPEGRRQKRNDVATSTSATFRDEPASPTTSQVVKLARVHTSDWVSSCPVHRVLNQLEQEFRLLYLHPSNSLDAPLRATLQYWSLASPPRYAALSYSWGEAPGQQQIWLNDTRFGITRNLHSALQQLRSYGYTTLWVDALCIDQNDLEERSLQVNRMRAIYRNATEVAVWLGREANGSDYVMSALAKPNGVQTISVPQLQRFLERSYWQRTWIVQEIVSATRLAVFCGAHKLAWQNIDSQLHLLMDMDDVDASQLQSLSNLCHLRRAQAAGQATHFLELFRRTRNLSATDRRDKIFAILGLAFDGPSFVPEPNYKLDERELCLLVTTTAIKVQMSLDIILLASGKPDGSRLPSWCPDYLSVSTHPFPAGMIDYLHGKTKRWRLGIRSKRWNATAGFTLNSKNFNIQGDVLQVYGLPIGLITGLSAPADCLEPGQEIYSVRSPCGSDMAILHALGRIFWLYDSEYKTFAQSREILPYLWAALESSGVRIFRERTWGTGEYYAPNCHKVLRWMKLNADFVIQGKTLREWADMSGEGQRPNFFRRCVEKLPKLDDREDRLAMTEVLDENLRLITTDRDNLGWAHPESRPGDGVYLLAGCSTPVVLRYDRKGQVERLDQVQRAHAIRLTIVEEADTDAREVEMVDDVGEVLDLFDVLADA